MKVKVGEYIKFGRYPQNEDGNDKTPIEWRVLAVEGNKALLISKYVLDYKEYNTASYTKLPWETCTLRSWLNQDFLNTAFSASEQANIQSSKVTIEDYYLSQKDTGTYTIDKIFLLSMSETERYFSSYEDKMCVPTAYTISKGIERIDYNANCCWWLRSAGNMTESISFIGYFGTLFSNGCYLGIDAIDGVRPAMWITLEA